MSGSLLIIGLLGRNQFKEALTSFPPHHAAPAPRRSSQIALTMLICEGPEILACVLRPGNAGANSALCRYRHKALYPDSRIMPKFLPRPSQWPVTG
jgi:hypothetical protein